MHICCLALLPCRNRSERKRNHHSAEPPLMCLAGSRCLEKLCDSVEVTGEIFTDFHLQSGLFMWLQRLCKDLDSSCCYVRSNRTTMFVEYVHTLPLSANSKWCFAVFIPHNAIKNNSFHVSVEVLKPRMMRRLGCHLV